ncbi:MAG: GntR family transcriptional regulator [Pseudomonadota bacterium]
MTGIASSSGRRVEALTQALAKEIADGLLAPGVRLDEQTLATRFAISRTPVREALNRLVAIGLAERQPHRGVLVASVGMERLGQMFEVMTELEGTCARFAAERMKPEERAALALLHNGSAAAASAEDVEAYVAFNRRFHEAIYRGSHNPFLVETTQAVRRRLAPFRNAQFNVAGRPSASFLEHEAVVEAIGRGDGLTAHAAMVRHIAQVRDAYRSLAERPMVSGGSALPGANHLAVPDR